MGYGHLSIDERERIMKMTAQGWSFRQIGERLQRQFFPNGMDFSTVGPTEVDRTSKLLNNRPRKCLNYRTPTKVFWS